MNSRFNDPHRAQRDLLRGCELLGGLPPDVLSELVAASRIVELSVNRTLYEAGELIREAHILFNGSVKRAVSMPGSASHDSSSCGTRADTALSGNQCAAWAKCRQRFRTGRRSTP